AESRVPKFNPVRSYALYGASQSGVVFFKMYDGFTHRMLSGVHCKGCLALILLAGAPIPAQEPPSIRVDVDLVTVLCSVRDAHGALVSHLHQDDFILLEEGKPQTIRHFARETDLPLTVGLLVDTSNSQVRLIGDELHAATQFFAQVIHP